jgi:hypothetical protein
LESVSIDAPPAGALPAVGPEALPLDGAAHLGIEKLSEWTR